MLSSKLPATLLLLLGLTNFSFQHELFPRISTPYGKIKGVYKLTQNGRIYESYEGIPYAQSPVGKLRFQPPEPISRWDDELDATKPSASCLQYRHVVPPLEGRVAGSEDCLFLNIYTPDRKLSIRSNGTLLPVIVWIHGGAFQFGTGRPGGKFVLDRNVVFVGMNYRLGPFGFLSTEDEVVPGNMGLKDQSMALRWISNNIEYFGGDPKCVTLAGHSAGGASVHYHYLSPMSRGLFKRGISVSGTALDPWTQTEKSGEKAKKLAAILGCPTCDTKNMIECLRKQPGHKISNATGHFLGWLYNPFTPFGPVVEKASSDPFIDRPPIQIMRSGDAADLSWITGVVSVEGLYPAAEFIANARRLKELEENWNILAPYLLDFNYTIPKSDQAVVAQRIKKHYLGNEKISPKTVAPLLQMVGDRLFVVDSEISARLHAQVHQRPVWYYYYSYRPTQSLSDVMSGTIKDFGTAHGDDVFLLLEDAPVTPITKRDFKMQNRLLDIWESYATHGVPKVGNVKWHPIDPYRNSLRSLRLASPDRIDIGRFTNLGEKNFWKTIHFNENK